MIRVTAREGQKRIEIEPTEKISTLFTMTQKAFGYNSAQFSLFKDRQKAQEIIASQSMTVSKILNHGDMIFLTPKLGVVLTQRSDAMEEDLPSTSKSTSRPSTSAITSDLKKVSVSPIEEDEVDVYLKTQDGLIKRSKDSKMCRHGENGCCVFCAPMEPYDEAYLKEQNIKHISFHSYLKKLTGGVDKGKFVALEDLSVSIKEGCTTHPPFPEGICSKCQPSAVTLNRQVYRHVDNIMFENRAIVERFLSYWRSSGHQRMGFLYGSYEVHNDVPLGIRGKVVAIYEPPQESTRDNIRFSLNDEKAPLVTEIATALGLKCLGWVFTDLITEDISKGTVKHVRGIHSHFLSAQECITAAYFQNLHPNPCKLAPKKGVFGSKFATVLITGDETNQVHMEGYQVSNQCMALVRDKCLVPTRDAPELGYVKESSKQQYVPDVYYKQKDEYGNEVPRLGRPLPVEYLLVDLPVASPIEQKYSFSTKGDGIRPFPVANRFVDGQLQDFNALSAYLNQFPKGTPFIEIARDFHFLLFIASMDIVPIKEYIGPLLEAVRLNQPEKANDWSKSEHWATVEQLVAASTITPSISTGTSAGSSGNAPIVSPQTAGWACTHCTFVNASGATNCIMCALPRVAA